MTTIGIIGGSGLYALEGLGSLAEVEVETPFGKPSDALLFGELDGTELVFLPRHGRNHRLLPTEVPYRANVFAMKKLGVEWLISVSAVGSMREEIAPGDFVLPDQYIDRTFRREPTFFGDGLAAHVSVADPTCATLRPRVARVIEEVGIRCHAGGTYICIEGPAFSTRAESHLYRSWGVSVIGMTAVPEFKLAREAELHYITIALATDYDCWHEAEEDVSAEAVLETLEKNTAAVKKVISRTIGAIAADQTTGGQSSCSCASAMRHTLLTPPDAIPPERREDLALLLGKYI